jgi:L-threonylcarbamoyladenylate synthase
MLIIETKNTSLSPNHLKSIISVLNKGGLIIYPTETCYGAGVLATSSKGVNKLLAFKGARGQKAISIAVADKIMAQKFVVLNDAAKNLYRNFLPGPITVISRSKSLVDRRLETPQHTLGVRIPNYSLALNILAKLKSPLTATSANASGRKQAYSLDNFIKYNPKKSLDLVDIFINAGSLPERQPSTIVDTTLNETTVIRQGTVFLDKNKTTTFTSCSESATKKYAQNLTLSTIKKVHNSPLVIFLQGELGAGKTQFAKGIGQALGINQNINSPTYHIIKEYAYEKGSFYHLDTWRLTSEEIKQLISNKRLFRSNNIITVEWPQKISHLIKQLNQMYPILMVNIETTTPTTRKISSQLRFPEVNS